MSNPYFQNAGGNQPPTYQGDKLNIWAEIRKLWIRIEQLKGQPPPPNEKAWSASGIVAPGEQVNGQPWAAPCNLILSSLSLTLWAPSSTTYRVATVIADVDVITTAIEAGSRSSLSPIQQRVSKGTLVWPRLLPSVDGDGEMLGIVYRWEPEAR